MEKQIEFERNEIAEIIATNFDLNNGEKWDASDFEWSAHCVQVAGYRKASDVAREMQERFKELMGVENASCGYCNAVGYWSVKAVKDNIDRIADEILNKTEE